MLRLSYQNYFMFPRMLMNFLLPWKCRYYTYKHNLSVGRMFIIGEGRHAENQLDPEWINWIKNGSSPVSSDGENILDNVFKILCSKYML